ncbi:hypothetical protein [Natrinema altunense]|uniref:Uncharacterized protein n=1 Tax=Natrinema altunense (strain JCM 12890 / CGMCC 1.3731 / AJ2) TaxID=1227494 RepID=M0A0A3_NATA2|nr:hypothetical protein [Natrinema altunense]ELY91267.1 hypothetical protein C485_01949 [Natrinema altunense JCM 12890]
MQGNIDPTFGSRPVDAGVSVALASFTLLGLYALQRRTDTPKGGAAASSGWYVLMCALVYLGPRYVHDTFASGVFTFQYLLWVFATVLPLVALQAGLPVYIFATRGNVGALVGLFAVTVVTFWGLLGTGGESDILIGYPYAVFPVAVIIVSVTTGVDIAARKVVNRVSI